MSSTKLTLSASAQRVLAIATAGALLPLGFAGAASAQTTPAQADITKNACPADQVEAQGYTDIATVSSENQLAINCIAEYGIAEGTTATTYSPTAGISRAQMALFLARYLDYAGETPDTSDAGFTDIAGLSQEAQDAVNTVANAGIALGTTASTYSPTNGVSRAQMASFINRLQAEIEGTDDSSFDTTTDYFTDDDGLGAEDAINALASAGIVAGTGGGNYSPTAGVSRAQMALFIARSLEVNVAAGEFDSAYAPVVTSNQTFGVNPDAAETRVLVADESAGTAAVQDADNRTFSASGLTNGTTYRVTLVDNDNITVGDDGQVTFLASADTDSSTKFSAATGDVVAQIVSVNNGDITAAQTTLVTPVNGNITFEIDGIDVGSVTPVLYVNGGAGGTATTGGTSIHLEVQATAADQRGVPVESFGIGGTTTFVATQAESGFVEGVDTTTFGAVTAVDKTANTFNTGTGAGTRRFNYDANDQFTVDGVSVGLDGFEAALSSDDRIRGTFTRDAAGVSQFILDDRNPPQPTAVTAENGTDSSSNDITVAVTFPIGEDVDSVIIQRATVTGADGTDGASTGTVGTYATVATATPTAAQILAGTVTYVDNDVAVGVYRYQAALVNDGDQSAFQADTTNEASTAPAADASGPKSDDARVSNDSGFAGTADAGDVFTFVYNEALAAPAAGATLRIQDGADGTVADVVNGTNATFSLNAAAVTYLNGAAQPAGEVLTVTLTGSPTVIAAGTTPGLQYGTTTVVSNSSGVTDLAGNRYDVVGSTDKGLNVAANVTTAPAATASNSILSAVAVNASNEMTVTYTANVQCSSVAVSDFAITLTGTGAITPSAVACTGADDNTLVFTFPGTPFATGNTGSVTVTANSVNNAAGTPQTTSTVNYTVA